MKRGDNKQTNKQTNKWLFFVVFKVSVFILDLIQTGRNELE